MFTRIFSRRNPYIIEGFRTFGIMATGDVLAQTVVEKKVLKEVDYIRTVKYGSLGLLFVGPVLKYWYGLLDRRITTNKSRLQRALRKMLVDQTVMAPIINLSIAIHVGVINGDSNKAIKERLKVQYLDIMKTNYMLWPAAQMVNFSIVPINYQVVFAQVVAVVWNCFLSQLLNSVI